MYCEHCGGALAVGSYFCGDCGAAVPVQPPSLSPPPLSATATATATASTSASPVSAAGHPEWEAEEPTITFSRRTTNRWQVLLPNGTIALIEGPLLIGRRPDPAAGPHGARLLTVDDPDRTVSRSHLVITPSANGVRVTDVSGHNGTVVTGADGAEQRLRGTSIELSTPSQLTLGALSVWLQPA